MSQQEEEVDLSTKDGHYFHSLWKQECRKKCEELFKKHVHEMKRNAAEAKDSVLDVPRHLQEHYVQYLRDKHFDANVLGTSVHVSHRSVYNKPEFPPNSSSSASDDTAGNVSIDDNGRIYVKRA
jgi:hypothetical protein